MIDVVCFCGCSYSFGGDEGACPQCGEIATLLVGPPANAVPAVQDRFDGLYRATTTSASEEDLAA
jgi:hypothetical protein